MPVTVHTTLPCVGSAETLRLITGILKTSAGSLSFSNPRLLTRSAFRAEKSLIYSGLFQYIHNDAELAMVVGHEMAHALCRHISEQQETELFTGILGTAVELTLEDKRYHKGYNAASHLGITLPYSRKSGIRG